MHVPVAFCVSPKVHPGNIDVGAQVVVWQVAVPVVVPRQQVCPLLHPASPEHTAQFSPVSIAGSMSSPQVVMLHACS